MIDAAYHRTIDLLTLRKGEVEKLAKELLDKEVLHKSDVEALIGMRPYEEEKVVTFDVEEVKSAESKTEATAEQTTTVTDATAPVEPSTNNEASAETTS
jgi:cell division protease FtsH